jgi:hypothetical protein
LLFGFDIISEDARCVFGVRPMRFIPFVVVLLFAAPAMAQYQPNQPPNLGQTYQQSLDNIQRLGQPQPSYQVQPAPNNGYIIQSPSGRSMSCRAAPNGGYDCQ